MICKICGNEMPDQAKFCTRCGAPAGAEPAGQQPVPGQIAAESQYQQDGSFRAVWEGIKASARGLNLNKFQKGVTIAAACTLLCFLIYVSGSFLSWICAISAAALLWLCMKKVGPESVTTASVYSFLMIPTLATGIINISEYGAGYFTYSFEMFLVHMISYALLVFIWICAVKKTGNRRAMRLTAFIIACVLEAYELIYFFSVIAQDAKSAFYGLGWLGIIGIYGIQIFMAYKNTGAAAPVMAGSAPVPAAPLAPGESVFCTRCGAQLPKGSTFCDMCGASVKAPENSSAEADQNAMK